MPLHLEALRHFRPFVSTLLRGLLAGVLIFASSTSATAQGLCFEPGSIVASTYGTSKVSAAFDGDHDVDFAFAVGNAVYLSRNLGNGTFAVQELVYQAGTGVSMGSVVAADFDGDLDTDLA